MTKHEKVTNELMHLIAQHPDRQIMLRVPTEGIVCSDEFSWWSAQFSAVYLDSLCEIDEVLYLRSKSMDELFDKFTEEEEPHVDLDVCDWDLVEERAESRLSSISWSLVIVVEIEAWTG